MDSISQLITKSKQIQQKTRQQEAQKGDFGALLQGGGALDLGDVNKPLETLPNKQQRMLKDFNFTRIEIRFKILLFQLSNIFAK